jgi:two-component system, chemotaxis family, chemotaxis protein CheY
MRVLTVDDSRAMRLIIRRALRGLGDITDILEANSAEAAIEVLNAESASGMTPDLILCDWNMGGMTGLDFLTALRGAGWDVPLGFVTSESTPETVERALRAGALFVLPKPFTAADLAAGVEAAFYGEGTTFGRDGGDHRPITAVLQGLTNAKVHVSSEEAGPTKFVPRQVAYFRTHEDDAESTAIVIVDTQLACAMAAALALLPAATAREWASVGALPEELSENFHEVMNILGKVFRASGTRFILDHVDQLAPGEPMLEAERYTDARVQRHYRIEIEHYESGLASFLNLETYPIPDPAPALSPLPISVDQ